MSKCIVSLLTLFASAPSLAAAPANDVRFGTNLDKPRTIIVARDSINYRLSDDLIKVLAEINKGKPAGEQIQLRSFGRNFTPEQFDEERENGGTTASLSRLPETPIVDLVAKNAQVADGWFQHSMQRTETWLQDALEFFRTGASLSALSFKDLLFPDSFLTDDEKAENKKIEVAYESDDTTEEEMEKLEARSNEIHAATEARAEAATKQLVADLGLTATKTLENLDAEAGDFETLPGDVVITSIKADEGLGDIKTWLKGSRYDGRILSLDANWFTVGHVDEFVSAVPAQNKCGFALMTFDPLLGLELLKAESKAGLEQLIPADYVESSPPGAGIAGGLDSLYDYETLKKVDDYSENAKEQEKLQASTAARAAKLVADLKTAYAKLNPSCGEIPVIQLPTLVTCDDFDGPGTNCGTITPNPVNSIVLGHDVLVPDPYLPTFRAEIQKRLAAAGLSAHLVDSGFYHMLRGEAHCATNVIRDIK